MIKRSPSLTDQVKTHIKQQILINTYEDDRIPSETDLAMDLGVSRTTIRDALSRLENEGVVYRKQGSGTYVNRPGLQIKSRLDEIWSYSAVLEAHGYRPAAKVLEVKREAADPDLAGSLGLSSGDELVVVRKLFLENRKPVIFTGNYIPAALIELPFKDSDLELPVFDFLSEYAGEHLSYYLTEIVPITATESLAEVLKVPPETAVLSLEEVGYNEENQPILKAYSYFRDDLLRLGLIRRKV
jgi:GntR family transcriptional regulator